MTGVIAMVLILTIQSCKKEMIDKNTDPNIVTTAPPEYQFTNATADLDYTGAGQLENRYQFMVYMQYVVPDGVNANLSTNYWVPGATTGGYPSVSYYTDFYSGIGDYMQLIINQIDQMSATGQTSYAYLKAICQILYVYHAWRVVDLYGAMPYHQAFNIYTYPYPEYDYDWTLYKTFDSTLKVAAVSLNSTTIPSAFDQQDLIYNGNQASWEALANTLRIKIAQRYQQRDPSNFTAVINDVGTNFGAKIISSNTQSFGISHTQTWDDNEDNINTLLLTYDAGYAFVQFLKATKDPRLSLMIRQNDGGTNAPYYDSVVANGAPSALALLADSSAFLTARYQGKHAFPASEAAAYGWTGSGHLQQFDLNDGNVVGLDVLSQIQTRFFIKNGGWDGLNQSGIYPHTDESTATSGLTDLTVAQNTIQNRTLFLTYAETCFMMCEIALQSGGTAFGQSASQWYNQGVTASYVQYESDAVAAYVPGADSSSADESAAIGAYLAAHPFNNSLTQLYSQEWVHFMIEPEEAYALWKRTGYPQFVSNVIGTVSPIGNGTDTAYLESLWSGSANLVIPRRTIFDLTDAGSTLNSTNFNSALSEMESYNPNFGANGNYAIGSIWWDEQ